MNSSSSDSNLHLDSSTDQHRVFGAIRLPRFVDRNSDVPTSPGYGRSVTGDAAADCRAVLVGEQRLFRDGLMKMLQKSRLSVIGEAHDIYDLLSTSEKLAVPELVIWHVASDEDPELIPDMVDYLRRHFAEAKFVVLTEACSGPLLSSFVLADVDAILPTNISREMLVRSLELVLCDVRLFPAGILAMFAISALGRLSRDPDPNDCSDMLDGAKAMPVISQLQAALPSARNSDPRASIPLSVREQQIVDCLVRGLSNKHIARELNIADATVKVHVKTLLRKIRVDNRTQVATWAFRQSCSDCTGI